jgi:hypothetical protein
MAKSKSKPMYACEPDKEWQAQSDARTLMDASKIRSDRARLKAAQAWAAKQAAELKSVSSK